MTERIAYTETEVEALTGIKRKTLQGWRLRRQGPPYVKVGRRLVRYPAEDLHRWIHSLSGGGATTAGRP
jgi:predicted DNA-binding transcriptional regulator AlpA